MQWTLPELVSQVAERIAALPEPRNGQVRAVPDDRTVRYYGTIGLLDRPLAMRGRTALYGPRHLAQVVAIKRLQSAGRSLAEIQELWPTLDDPTLARMSGVSHAVMGKRSGKSEFWKQDGVAPAPTLAPVRRATPSPTEPAVSPPAAVELRVQLAPGLTLTIEVGDTTRLALSPADVAAIRAAAAPLVTELAHRRLTPHAGEEDL
ncbi:MAG: MerR family transcriptional regulator [Myxococcales bacterium]|nr:MerR family transcriptional regulator [Myxococcales bacterium]